MRYKYALALRPGKSYPFGITEEELGMPDYELTIQQHESYCQALRKGGLYVDVLEAEESFPDSCFVEDTAVITDYGAIITLPGAPSRRGEVKKVEEALRKYVPIIGRIEEPGKLDGGDIVKAENHFFNGLSRRTNEEGARQLQKILRQYDYSFSTIDVPDKKFPNNILHLITGSTYIGRNTFVSLHEFADIYRESGFKVIEVPGEEKHAANLVAINDHLLIPDNCPRTREQLEDFNLMELETGEFRKQQGSLTCLSIRIPELKFI